MPTRKRTTTAPTTGTPTIDPRDASAEALRLDDLVRDYERLRSIVPGMRGEEYSLGAKLLDTAEHRLVMALLRYKQPYPLGAWVYSAGRTTGDLWRRPRVKKPNGGCW